MALTPGTTLGSYEVLAAIGAGGMGEVYKARDTKLDRDVALKILPDAFVNDPERLARFQREAKVLASLNHPNIAQIHGLEDSGDSPALVLEYVEGPTLQDRISQGPLPLDEALPIARQIAEALEAAHEQGIVHRDLKPANVKVKNDGTVKVLDFGLAKALEPEQTEAEAANSPTMTMTAAATRAGFIMGTAAYMSPEQARGNVADRRSDIWSFGVVLLEMLTGKLTFSGKTISDTLAAVLRQDLDWTELPSQTPRSVRRLLRRCLEKESKQRLGYIGDARLDIDDAKNEPRGETPAAGPVAQSAVWQRPLAIAGTVLVAALVAGAAVWAVMRPAPAAAPEVQRFTIDLSSTAGFLGASSYGSFALSPDGAQLAYVAAGEGRQIYLRALDQLEARPLPGAEDAYGPFFSPDGESLGFFTGAGTPQGRLKRISLRGGPPLTLAESNRPTADWETNDSIVFATEVNGSWSLFRVPATGGTPERLTTPGEGEHHGWPDVLPGGAAVVYSAATGPSLGAGFEDSRIELRSLESGETRTLIEQGYHARYVPSGHLAYVLQDTLMAVPFDLERLVVTGSPAPMLEGLQTDVTFGFASFDVSPSGLLVYTSGSGSAPTGRIVRRSRTGAVLETLVGQPLEYPRYIRIAPSGDRVVLTTGTASQGDLWVYPFDGRPPTPLTFEQHNLHPVWSPDGARIAFQSTRGGSRDLYVMPADGSTLEAEPLLPATNDQFPYSWSPDGRELLYFEFSPETGRDIWALGIDEAEPRVVVQTEYHERDPILSSDGRWLAYRSDVTGSSEIWVRDYAGERAPVRVSPNGGDHPRWGPDDLELYYLEDDRVMAVGVETEPALAFTAPERLFDGVIAQGNSSGFYDVAPDGTFVVVEFVLEPVSGTDPGDLIAVVNWVEELNERVPVP